MWVKAHENKRELVVITFASFISGRMKKCHEF